MKINKAPAPVEQRQELQTIPVSKSNFRFDSAGCAYKTEDPDEVNGLRYDGGIVVKVDYKAPAHLDLVSAHRENLSKFNAEYKKWQGK